MDYRQLYRDMKNKFKIAKDDMMYSDYIEDVISQMFIWDDKIYRPQFFDRMLRDVGMAALITTDTSDYTPVWFTPVDLGGGRYADGWFKDCVCFDFIGHEFRFKDWQSNPDILVFFNTALRNPDAFVNKYATMLSDVDFSIVNNVHYSRQHPFPVAKDKKTKARIDQCIKDVANGDFSTVLMEATLGDVIDGTDEIQTINITDVTKSEYLQYLSHLYDALISRLFFHIGLGTTDNGKQAQITTDELNRNKDASITMCLSWYEARKAGFEVAREKGHDLFFDFSDLWKMRVESILHPEQFEEEPTEESTEEPKEGDNNDDSGDSDS